MNIVEVVNGNDDIEYAETDLLEDWDFDECGPTSAPTITPDEKLGFLDQFIDS